MRSGRPAMRARLWSWHTTATPSAVACVSVSMYRYPIANARANAAMLFSSPCAAPPRWAKAIGVGASR